MVSFLFWIYFCRRNFLEEEIDFENLVRWNCWVATDDKQLRMSGSLREPLRLSSGASRTCAPCVGKANESYEWGISALNELTGPFPICPEKLASCCSHQSSIYANNAFMQCIPVCKRLGRIHSCFALRYSHGCNLLNSPTVNVAMAHHDDNSESGLS